MKIRSFIAVDPSVDVQREISQIIRGFKEETAGIRWVAPDGIHLTLRFLGSVEEGVIEEIISRLTQLGNELKPIRLAARGIGFFPNPARARIVWVGLDGELGQLKVFQEGINEVLRDLPLSPVEEREFKPHLTIGRIRDPGRVSGIAKVVRKGEAADFGSFTADSFFLYKSELTPQGARYTRLGEFRLNSVKPNGG